MADAARNLVAINSALVALEHGNLTGHPWEWNLVWRAVCEPFDAFKRSAADAAEHEAVLVARLKASLVGPVQTG